MGQVRTASIADEAGDGPVTLTGQNAAKAHAAINFATVGLLDSFNVSSFSDNGLGDFSYSLTNSMSDSTFNCGTGCLADSFGTQAFAWSTAVGTVVTRCTTGAAYYDGARVQSTVHGDLA